MCEDKYIFMALQRQKHAEQSQLDITAFRNQLLNKAQLLRICPLPMAFGAISSLRDEGFPSTSEGSRVSPKIPKAGLKNREEKGDGKTLAFHRERVQPCGLFAGATTDRGHYPPALAVPRVHQRRGPGTVRLSTGGHKGTAAVPCRATPGPAEGQRCLRGEEEPSGPAVRRSCCRAATLAGGRAPRSAGRRHDGVHHY